MHTFPRIIAALAICFALLSTRAHAQFQVSAVGSYVAPVEQGSSLTSGVWGPGATLRYFVKPGFAIGLNARYYSNRSSFGDGTYSFVFDSKVVVVTAEGDYFFSTTSALRPYVGLEAGLFHNRVTNEITSGTVMTYYGRSSSFGATPKAGLQYAITPVFGIHAETGLQFIVDGNTPSTSLLLNAGVFLTFGSR